MSWERSGRRLRSRPGPPRPSLGEGPAGRRPRAAALLALARRLWACPWVGSSCLPVGEFKRLHDSAAAR